MQLNKLFQLSMEEALGLSCQQVSEFVDRASSRVAPSGHEWHPFDELVRKPGLLDVHRLVSFDDLWGAAALLAHRFCGIAAGRGDADTGVVCPGVRASGSGSHGLLLGLRSFSSPDRDTAVPDVEPDLRHSGCRC